MIIVGIDPGLRGGLAAVSFLSVSAQVTLVDARDVPVVGEGGGRRVDVAAVVAWLQRHEPGAAYIERAQAMPVRGRHGAEPDEEWKGQGASSAFIYGRSVGALEASVQGMQIPLKMIETLHWKKAHALIKSDKEASRQRALKLFPSGRVLFDRKRDHNRADAALIAWFGAMLARS